MKFKNFFSIEFLLIIILFFVSVQSLQAEDSIEKQLKEQAKVTEFQIVNQAIKSGQWLYTGMASTLTSASINDLVDQCHRQLKDIPYKHLKGLEKFGKYGGKVFIYIDVYGTSSKMYDDAKKGDLVAMGEKIIDHVGSAAFSELAIAGAVALGVSNPFGLVAVGIGGAAGYTGLVGYIREPGEDGKVRVIPYVMTEADKRRAKEWRRKECIKAHNEYIADNNKRPHHTLFDICKEYGMDIYDLCKDDPDKRDPGECDCNIPDIDLDGDGVYSCNGANDECDDNPKLTKKGKYGKDGCQTEDDWRMEQVEASGLKCTRYQFIQWNEEKNIPECVCQGGMVWDKGDQECIDERLVIDGEAIKTCKDIKNAELIVKQERRYCNCIEPFKWADDKKLKCVCPKPLVINKAENDCITCNERYPGSIPANTEKGCGCPKKTRWVKDLNKCANQKELAEYCDIKLPGSVAGKKDCVCPEGREKSEKLGICVETPDANKTATKVLDEIVYRIEGGGFTPHYDRGSYEKVGYRDVLFTLREPATEAYLKSIIEKVYARFKTDPCETHIPITPGYKMHPSIWKNGPKVTIIRGPTSGLSSELSINGWKIIRSDGPSFSELKEAAGCKK